MDDQHGILMDAINALRLALVRGAGQEKISELLDEFLEFTRMHFWSEEQLMERTGFAGWKSIAPSTIACWPIFCSRRIGCNTAKAFNCALCSAICTTDS